LAGVSIHHGQAIQVMGLIRGVLTIAFLFIATFGSAFLSESALAQSFNCRDATGPDEVLICQNPMLAVMDEKLANLFAAYRRLTGDAAERRQLEIDQAAWLSYRRTCGRDAVCIAEAYRNRVQYLYENNTPEVCGGPILTQPVECDAGGAFDITDDDIAAIGQ
jgi:uncharacterized protein